MSVSACWQQSKAIDLCVSAVGWFERERKKGRKDCKISTKSTRMLSFPFFFWPYVSDRVVGNRPPPPRTAREATGTLFASTHTRPHLCHSHHTTNHTSPRTLPPSLPLTPLTPQLKMDQPQQHTNAQLAGPAALAAVHARLTAQGRSMQTHHHAAAGITYIQVRERVEGGREPNTPTRLLLTHSHTTTEPTPCT